MATAMTSVVPVTDSNACRLCQVHCGGNHKCINGENSEMNEVYKITVKYFPAKFLEPCRSSPPAALCLECWRHIIEFHSFQELIFDTQKNLLGRQHEVDIDIKHETILHRNDTVDVTPVDVKPKLGSTPVLDKTLKNEVPNDENCQNIENKSANAPADVLNDSKEEYIFDISLSDLEDIDIEFSTDDEMSVSGSLDTRKENEIKTLSQNPTQTTPQCNVSHDSKTCDDKGKKPVDQTGVVKDIEKVKCKPKLQCWICNKTALTFELLHNHFQLNHSSRQCYITCCQLKLTSKLELDEHIELNHSRKEGFMCEICKIEYPRASILKKHRLQRHKPTKLQFDCPKCPKILPARIELAKHYKAHFVCHKCSKVFHTTEALQSHTKMVHNTTRIIPKPAASLESFTCEKCGKTMNSKSIFETHQRFAHMYDCKYKCHLCEETFKKVLHFRDHMNYHSKDNYYACGHCSDKFQHWAHLESHMNLKHAHKSTKQYMYQLLLAEEKHVLILNNSSPETNGNSETNTATKTIEKD